MGECVECEEGCENCSSLRFCEKCEDGYFERKDLEGNEIGICGKCKPHCKTCVNEFEICT